MKKRLILLILSFSLIGIAVGAGRPHAPQSADIASAYKLTIESIIQISHGIQNYALDFGTAPQVAGFPELRDKLIPAYMVNIPQDAWGKDFIYKVNEKNPEQYWLASGGSDGIFKGFDQKGTWDAPNGQDLIFTNAPPSWIYGPAMKDLSQPDFKPAAPSEASPFITHKNPGTALGIVRHPPASAWGGYGEVLESFPVPDPNSRNPFALDFRGDNLGKLDLSGKLTDLLKANFDDATTWPAKLPAGFDPARFMETGRNPGLGVRELHKRGITGKGVGLAIIDMGFLVDHVEYKDRVRLFEEIHSGDETAQMHGVATASIALGKSVGVAPEADLYYIASFPAGGGDSKGRDFSFWAQAIDRILEINRTLPADRKIRVISMSIGWDPSETGYADIMAAVERAKKEGVFTVCTSMEQTYGFVLFGLGREPGKDPERFDSFGEASWGGLYPHEQPGGKEALLFPMDSRTTASPTGVDRYAFYRLGGLSWSVPWAAGLYALACQVKPDLTPELFWKTALETGDTKILPPKSPNLTAEEIDGRIRKTLDERISTFKARSQGKDFEVFMAEIYSRSTGQKKERMNEAEFRTWAAERVRPEILMETKPRELKKIINPVRLIEALEKTKK